MKTTFDGLFVLLISTILREMARGSFEMSPSVQDWVDIACDLSAKGQVRSITKRLSICVSPRIQTPSR